MAVTVDEAGKIHVLDVGNYRLFTYSADGKLEGERGRRGRGPEEFPYLAENSSELAVADEIAVVMMPSLQRLLVWDLTTDAVSTIRIAAYPTSLALHDSTIYVTVASTAEGEVEAAVRAYSLDGSLVAEFGDRFQPEWDDPATPHLVRVQNRSILSASPQGTLFEAGRWWPWLQAYDGHQRVWGTWLEFGWLRAPPLRQFMGRPQSRLASFSLVDIESDRGETAPRIFDIAASRRSVFLLLGNTLNIQELNHSGEPLRLFWLLPDGVTPDDAPSMRPLPSPRALAIGVSPDGSRLCTASHQTAKVLCYDLPSN